MKIKRLVKLKFYFPFIENLFCFLGIISVTFGFMMFYTNILPTIPPNSDIMSYYSHMDNQ